MTSVSKKIFAMLVTSVFFYSVGGVMVYEAARQMPTSYVVLLYAIGGLFGVLVIYKTIGVRLKATRKAYLFALSNAAIVVSLLYLLFISYKRFDLAQIYPFLSLSVILFFAIDVAIYKKHIPKKMGFILLLGMILVVVGSFITGSSDLNFNYSLLPFIILFVILGGVADYLYFYRIIEYTIGSKIITFDLLFLVLGIILVLSGNFTGAVHSYIMAYGLFGGFAGVVATVFELKAMKIYNQRKISHLVAERNFINNFSYLDTVFVLIGSIIIGSFTYQEVLGGILLVIGVVIVGIARENTNRGKSKYKKYLKKHSC